MSVAAKLSRRTTALDSVLIVIVLLAFWQLAYFVAGDVAMSAPWPTVLYSLELLRSANYWDNAWATLGAFATGYLLAIVFGLIIGLALGFNRLLAEVSEPVLIAVYAIPKVTLFPIVLLFFGIGFQASVAFGVLNGVVPIMIFTMNAVRNVKPVYLKTAKVLRLGFARTMWTVVIPSALPEILAGMRIGFSLVLIGTLLSEMFGSKSGLGNILMRAIGLNQVELIMGLTLQLVVVAAIINSVLLAVERRLPGRP
jgi:NitT/TauT family transport system permease protein